MTTARAKRSDTAYAPLLRARTVDGVTSERLYARRSRRGADLGNHCAELSVSLALLQTARDDEMLTRADELSRLVPRSWLRRRYESLAAYALGPQLLSPAERRVMQAVAQGWSTAQIAERFGRSKNTIRNQTRRVYTVMNVNTRAALVVKCAALDRIIVEAGV